MSEEENNKHQRSFVYDIIHEINLTRILKYYYTGLLLFVAIFIIDKRFIIDISKIQGLFLIITIPAIGASFYLLHRHVIGAIFIYKNILRFHKMMENIYIFCSDLIIYRITRRMIRYVLLYNIILITVSLLLPNFGNNDNMTFLWLKNISLSSLITMILISSFMVLSIITLVLIIILLTIIILRKNNLKKNLDKLDDIYICKKQCTFDTTAVKFYDSPVDSLCINQLKNKSYCNFIKKYLEFKTGKTYNLIDLCYRWNISEIFTIRDVRNYLNKSEFSKDIKNTLEIERTEINFLYILSEITILSCIYLFITKYKELFDNEANRELYLIITKHIGITYFIILILAILIFLSAMYMHYKLHKKDGHMYLKHEDEIKTLLRENLFIDDKLEYKYKKG